MFRSEDLVRIKGINDKEQIEFIENQHASVCDFFSLKLIADQ